MVPEIWYEHDIHIYLLYIYEYNIYHDVDAHVPNFQLSARSSSFSSFLWKTVFLITPYLFIFEIRLAKLNISIRNRGLQGFSSERADSRMFLFPNDKQYEKKWNQFLEVDDWRFMMSPRNEISIRFWGFKTALDVSTYYSQFWKSSSSVKLKPDFHSAHKGLTAFGF